MSKFKEGDWVRIKPWQRPEELTADKYRVLGVKGCGSEGFLLIKPDDALPLWYSWDRFELIEDKGRKHSHYFKDVENLTEVDVYAVCDLFKVSDCSGAVHHAIKKLLLSGGRGGGKDYLTDLEEARDTLTRKIELVEKENEG